MPIITILGYCEEQLEVERKIIEATVGVRELALTSGQVTVFFLDARVGLSTRDTLIVKVEGLFQKPERTTEVRARLAQAIGEAVQSEIPARCLVEVFISSFDVAQGFWSSPGEDRGTDDQPSFRPKQRRPPTGSGSPAASRERRHP